MEVTQELSAVDQWLTFTGVDLPNEASQLQATKVAELAMLFTPFMQTVKTLREEALAIEVTDEDDAVGMKEAKALRIAIKNARVDAEKIRKQEKQFSLVTGRMVDFFGKSIKELAEITENHLKDQETYAERMEAARRNELRIKREEEIYVYALEGTRIDRLDTMGEDEYQNLLKDMKDAAAFRELKAKQEAEALAAQREAERVERERLQADRSKLREIEEKQAKEAAEAKQKEEQVKVSLGLGQEKDPIKAARFELWEFFNDEHDLILLESDLDEIIRRVKTYFLAVKAAKES